MSSARGGSFASLLAPALAPWRNRVTAAWADGPRPQDGASASASGPDPDRVLLLGGGPAVGFGVRCVDLALGGQLARALSARTGRGADVDILSRVTLPVAAVPGLVAEARLWRFDALVLTVGMEDAMRLLPLDQWEDQLDALLRDLGRSTSSTTRIVVAGIPTVTGLSGFEGFAGAVVELHARAMNRVMREVCARFPRASFTPLPDPVAASPGRTGGSPAAYEEMARAIADDLTPHLAAASAVGSPVGARLLRNRPDEEAARQRAVDALRDRDLVDHPALERIVGLARTLLSTSYAAITVVDGDRQWPLAQDGGRHDGIERAVSFCAHTIRGTEGFVVLDARTDARVAALGAAEKGQRFYAGFPIESPNGYRIGALCVVDGAARAADTGILATLRDLAKLVQRELARVPADDLTAAAV